MNSACTRSFSTRSIDDSGFEDADLIIAADGVNSQTRARFAGAFEPDVDVRKCRFIWLGTTRPFDAFTFAFEQTEHGWFQIHAYQFSEQLSTVIVETREETWAAHGLDKFNTEQSIAFCERLFEPYLGRPSAAEQCQSPARVGVAQFQSRGVQALAPRQHRPHRRRRPHGALLDRLGYQARDGRRHLAGATCDRDP